MTLLLHGAPNDVAQIVLTLFSLVSMAVFIAWCGLCKAVTKRVPADTDVYGVSNRAATISGSELTTSSHCVQFRQAAIAGMEDVFHSEPTAKSYRGEFEISTRVSAPSQLGRALPRVPTDVVLDDGCHPMYECIGPDHDSIVNQAYSKINESTSLREPRYDYPAFSVKELYAVPAIHDDRSYRSASQVYIQAGSDDPYSSIVSEPRRNDGSGDNDRTCVRGSICNVGSEQLEPSLQKEHAEFKEQELDQLYSTVRRSLLENVGRDSPVEGPSYVPLEDRITPQYVPGKSLEHENDESHSSQEPSYRYITVRESAHVIRERLRKQGQLTAPARDHYYSVIGNEYETVGDAQNSPYITLREPQTSGAVRLDLSINSSGEFVPPPPTSPIPDRSLNNSNKAMEQTLRHHLFLDDTVLARRVTEEREQLVEHSTTMHSRKTHSRLVNNSKPGSSTCSEVFAAPSLPVFNVKIERLVKLSGFRLTTSHENSQEHSPSCLPYKPNAPGLGNGKHGICPPKDCISRYTSSPTHSNNQASVTSCATQTGIFHGSCSVPTESTSTLPAVSGREKRDSEHLRKEQKGDTNMNMARLKRRPFSPELLTGARGISQSATSKPKAMDSQEEKRLRLGTIVTAKDYVSPIDLGTDRPWPMNNVEELRGT